ncbi:MAG: discoidin domain-containing protein [Sedimentisphaerales bacterium]|nr:discoidin domain-containing protein [Sedimentisphaerales bacterium]
MFKKPMSVVFILSILMIVPVHAQTIVWVSEWLPNADGLSCDYEWIDLLETEGYTVIADTTTNYMTLDQSRLAALNDADLVILSRTSNSGNYANDATEITQWNSVDTPLILFNSYITRSSRWQWINSTAITEFAAEAMMSVVEASHPIFDGVSAVNGQIDMIDGSVNSGQVTFINTSDIGSGTLISQRADDNSVWIAEWEAGVAFYNGTDQVPAEKRLLFTAGGSAAQASGTLNLTENGKKVFLNAVLYMLGIVREPEKASDPKPLDGSANIPYNSILSWTAGKFADTHNVYLGTVYEDVNNADTSSPLLVGPAQDSNTYSPGKLEFDQTYYWRVDEANAPPDNTVYKGNIWSFKIEPYAITIAGEDITATASSYIEGEGPENTINNSGLDVNDLHSIETSTMWATEDGQEGPIWIQYEFDKPYKLLEMLVWNYNGQSILAWYGFKEVTIEYSTDGTNWQQVPDVPEFAKAPGTEVYAGNITVPFGGIAAKFVRITAASNWSNGIFNQYGLSEVRFMAIPVSARTPSPDNAATDAAIDTTLGWIAGREATEHKVYLSTDQQAITDGTASATTVGQNSYGPLSLDLGTTYYWRVDEVNNAEVNTVWEGGVWSFTTQDYLFVEDFESYNDIPQGENGSNLVYLTWIDGYDNPSTNGSTMGYVSGSSLERNITHNDGKQSVPLIYNNSVARTSKVTVDPGELTIGRDWTAGSAQTLVIQIYGDLANNPATDQLFVSVNGKKKVYEGNISWPIWEQWEIDLASLGINLGNVNDLTIGIEGSGSGMIYLDDIALYRVAPAAPSEEIWIEAEDADTRAAPMNVYDDPNASGGKYISKDENTAESNTNPPSDGITTYTFDIVEGGTYRILGRVITNGANDSFWVRLNGATTNTQNHSSGWIQWSDMTQENVWGWEEVTSGTDDYETVLFTMEPGTYTFEVTYREDESWLDAILIQRID